MTHAVCICMQKQLGNREDENVKLTSSVPDQKHLRHHEASLSPGIGLSVPLLEVHATQGAGAGGWRGSFWGKVRNHIFRHTSAAWLDYSPYLLAGLEEQLRQQAAGDPSIPVPVFDGCVKLSKYKMQMQTGTTTRLDFLRHRLEAIFTDLTLPDNELSSSLAAPTSLLLSALWSLEPSPAASLSTPNSPTLRSAGLHVTFGTGTQRGQVYIPQLRLLREARLGVVHTAGDTFAARGSAVFGVALVAIGRRGRPSNQMGGPRLLFVVTLAAAGCRDYTSNQMRCLLESDDFGVKRSYRACCCTCNMAWTSTVLTASRRSPRRRGAVATSCTLEAGSTNIFGRVAIAVRAVAGVPRISAWAWPSYYICTLETILWDGADVFGQVAFAARDVAAHSRLGLRLRSIK
ncbi:hypothetical protein EDB83DRAFT_2327353 [Lactarius deliciosus]|nr:hypothetical protein EDB83DRAFT_2327353 [Lactarius deliciosus]